MGIAENPGPHVGIEIRGIYDGVAIWRRPDGSLINRFAGIPGYERLAARIQKEIDGDEP